jgi:hypothetical protein
MSNDKEYLKNLLQDFYKNKGKSVRDITIETYVTRIGVLDKLLEIDNVEEYLKYLDFGNVIKVLENKYKSLSSITTSIASILILLQALGVTIDDNSIIQYREYLSKTQDKKNIDKKKQLNTASVLKIDNEKIKNLKKKYEKIIKKINLKKQMTFSQQDDIQNYVIFSLYSLQAPVRNDYCNMKVITQYKDNLDSNFNYILKNKDGTFDFIFKNYKTVNLYGENRFTANKKLESVLQKYINYCGDGVFLFINTKCDPYSKSAMSQKIIDIFGAGITELRKFYLSNQFQILFEINKKIEETAKFMMNSKTVIVSNYLQLLQGDAR